MDSAFQTGVSCVYVSPGVGGGTHTCPYFELVRQDCLYFYPALPPVIKGDPRVPSKPLEKTVHYIVFRKHYRMRRFFK